MIQHIIHNENDEKNFHVFLKLTYKCTYVSRSHFFYTTRLNSDSPAPIFKHFPDTRDNLTEIIKDDSEHRIDQSVGC